MTTNHQPATLRCKHNTAGLILITLGSIFVLVGCTQVYKTLGLTEKQAQDQTEKDQEATGAIIDQARITTTEIVTTALAGLGAILSGILAKWLNTEKKITAALITGIESAANSTTKQKVKSTATSAGIEPKLHARVLALT